MEMDVMPEHAAETVYTHLIPQNVVAGPEKPRQEANHCVVFCKKVAPNVFEIKKGVAVVDGAQDLFHDGICMIAPAAKVVFVFE